MGKCKKIGQWRYGKIIFWFKSQSEGITDGSNFEWKNDCYV